MPMLVCNVDPGHAHVVVQASFAPQCSPDIQSGRGYRYSSMHDAPQSVLMVASITSVTHARRGWRGIIFDSCDWSTRNLFWMDIKTQGHSSFHQRLHLMALLKHRMGQRSSIAQACTFGMPCRQKSQSISASQYPL